MVEVRHLKFYINNQ